MGVDTNIYLGPYVSCKRRPVETVTSVRACTNPLCKTMPTGIGAASVKFCAQCGHPIGDSPRKVASWTHFADVVGDDVFVDLEGGYHDEKSKIVLLGSNCSTRGGDPRGFHHHGDAHEDMTGVVISLETCWFEDYYAEALGKLRESFDDVRVLWGFHMYYT